MKGDLSQPIAAPEHGGPPLRVLFLSWNFPPVVGGIEAMAEQLFLGLADRGHDVRLLTCGSEGYPPRSGVERASRPGIPAYVGFALRRGWTLCETWRPDVLLCGSVVSGPAAWWLSRRFGLPYLLVVYGGELRKQGSLYRASLRLFMAGAKRICAISRQTADLLWPFRVAADRVRLVYPGVRAGEFSGDRAGARAVFPEWEGRRVLLTVGRLIRRKGVLEFVEQVMPGLARRYPDVLYLVVGEDATRSLLHAERMKERIREAIGRLKLERHVQLLGRVEDARLNRIFHRADIFVLPGRDIPGDAEGFGIVFSEAALAGAPGVATRVGGMPEAVLDEQTGLVVEPDNPRALEEALARLLENGPLRRRMAAAGAEHVRRELDWPIICAKYETMLRECLPIQP